MQEKNNNLIVSPHIAGLTVDSQRKAANFALEVLENSLANCK